VGVFDMHCEASGVALDDETRLLFMLDGVPLLPPLEGNYDRYGKIERIAIGPELLAVEALAINAQRDDLDDLVGAAFEEQLRIDGKLLRYALIDDGVYRAVVATVATGGVERVESFELGPLGRKLLAPWEDEPRAKHAVEALTHFCAMGLAMAATTVDSPSEQYVRYSEVAGLIAKAEKDFAAHPLVLAAIAENARRWKERTK
jgi:hypothetical protein